MLFNYKCFLVQLESIKKGTHLSYIEELLEECEYFTDESEPGGFLTFLTIIQEQRKFALQYIKMDVVIHDLYKSKLEGGVDQDYLNDLGTSRGLTRMMKQLSRVETEKQGLEESRIATENAALEEAEKIAAQKAAAAQKAVAEEAARAAKLAAAKASAEEAAKLAAEKAAAEEAANWVQRR